MTSSAYAALTRFLPNLMIFFVVACPSMVPAWAGEATILATRYPQHERNGMSACAEVPGFRMWAASALKAR